MKKLLMLFAFVLIGMIGMAQTSVGSWSTFAGASADTVTASATKIWTLNLTKYTVDEGVNVEIRYDWISGTAAYTTKMYWSNDGTYISATAADSTAAISNRSADAVYMKNFATAGGKYLVVKVIPTSGTQKTKIYGWANSYTK